jgi:hypothetical protein
MIVVVDCQSVCHCLLFFIVIRFFDAIIILFSIASPSATNPTRPTTIFINASILLDVNLAPTSSSL